ncbi:MAG TPA: DUF4230 domain-containing protein [Verrucomicrobiae bacterium]|jgi:hypothetical protein|nr:DUF4230 domain-containing protein [Verrucomicrobiae bacterium]
MLKTFIAVVFAVAVFAVGIWMGKRFATKSGAGPREEPTDSVVEQIQTLSHLVTVKYVVEKVIILDDAKWYGESRVLLLAHGVVEGGINLERLKPEDVTVSGKVISIRLPPPELTDAYLDDRRSQVIDHTTGLLRTFDKDLEQTAREQAVMDVRAAAVQNGILNDATQRAELELALFLHEAGYQQVKFNGGKPFDLHSEEVSHF